MRQDPQPYAPAGAPFANGERDETDPAPQSTPVVRTTEASRSDDEDAAYAELLAFVAANKDDDTEVAFLPAERFREGR